MFRRTDRAPIQLSKNTVVFLQLFTKMDEFPDVIYHSESEGIFDYKECAQQLVDQFKGHLSLNHAVAFAEAFKKQAEDHIAEFDMDTSYEEIKEGLDLEW